jgi:hypothetical protein
MLAETGAVAKPAEYSGRRLPVNPRIDLTPSADAGRPNAFARTAHGSRGRMRRARGVNRLRVIDRNKTLQCDRALPRQCHPRGIGRFHTGDDRDA